MRDCAQTHINNYVHSLAPALTYTLRDTPLRRSLVNNERLRQLSQHRCAIDCGRNPFPNIDPAHGINVHTHVYDVAVSVFF